MTATTKTPGSFVARLKLARKVRGMAARELSRRAGLNPGHVSVLEGRKGSHVWPETAKNLAHVLDVDPSWLLYGTGRGPQEEAAPPRSKRAAKLPAAPPHGRVTRRA